jgi:hypothetical protein
VRDLKTAKIAIQEHGPEKRSVSLMLRDDGSIQMHTSDYGPIALEIWGKEDYEFWTTIPPNAAPHLAFELLRERFVGRASATDELEKLCKENGIPHEWESYP